MPAAEVRSGSSACKGPAGLFRGVFGPAELSGLFFVSIWLRAFVGTKWGGRSGTAPPQIRSTRSYPSMGAGVGGGVRRIGGCMWLWGWGWGSGVGPVGSCERGPAMGSPSAGDCLGWKRSRWIFPPNCRAAQRQSTTRSILVRKCRGNTSRIGSWRTRISIP